MRRVVITGLGAVTPLGNDAETTWENLKAGVSGIFPLSKFDPSGLPSTIAGEVKDFCPGDYISAKDILRLDPFVHYAAAAAVMAVQDAGFTPGPSAGKRERGSRHASYIELPVSAAVVIGSSRGGIMSLERAMEKNLMENRPFSAYLMSSTTVNMASSWVSITMGIKGPALGISTACASGTHAIGEALRMIQHGEVELAVAGGAEAPLCRLALGGYGVSGALSRRNDEPSRASRPFDRDRDGFVIAEGAGVLVLEELEHAVGRGAEIYAELAGYGTSSDAFHQTRPQAQGESLAIRKALDNACLLPDDVRYINAHGTSTPLGDTAEAEAIHQVFGSKARRVPVSSCKSMLGHMLGAAGAVEAAITALSVKRGVITPTINLDTADPQCDLNLTASAQKSDCATALSSSFGFGGVNAVLVLKRFTGL